MDLLRRWFSLDAPVERGFYVRSGVVLMALKYTVDALMVWLVSGALFSPLDYLNPVWSLRSRTLGPVPDWLFALMALWALPFLWIGLSMSVRRAAASGRSPWFGLGFAVPVLNYFVMLDLSLRKDHADASAPTPRPSSLSPSISAVLLGLAAGVGLALGMTLLSVYVLSSYGAVLFLSTPVVVGAASSFFFNRGAVQSRRATLIVALIALLLAAGCLLLFALEGLVCVAMALPLAAPAAVFGALIARAIASSGRNTGLGLATFALTLPLLAGIERWPAPHTLFEVKSTIEIAAEPAKVWPHVIGFSQLPAPHEWLFRTGIAYPVRATITGRGVGAVRYCEFSTGPFVEPITAWEQPARLAFDVSAQPAPMREWSPFRHAHPPHLDGYLRSKHGEFRLIPLAGGRTRLEGRTWYELDLAPQLYFAAWSHWAIQHIHTRVFAHIKTLAERDARTLTPRSAAPEAP